MLPRRGPGSCRWGGLGCFGRLGRAEGCVYCRRDVQAPGTGTGRGALRGGKARELVSMAGARPIWCHATASLNATSTTAFNYGTATQGRSAAGQGLGSCEYTCHDADGRLAGGEKPGGLARLPQHDAIHQAPPDMVSHHEICALQAPKPSSKLEPGFGGGALPLPLWGGAAQAGPSPSPPHPRCCSRQDCCQTLHAQGMPSCPESCTRQPATAACSMHPPTQPTSVAAASMYAE